MTQIATVSMYVLSYPRIYRNVTTYFFTITTYSFFRFPQYICINKIVVKQVSFTLLVTGRCNNNAVQYETNRRFEHLLYVLVQVRDGRKLPSVGLCLNASQFVSSLVEGGNDICRRFEGRKARHYVTRLVHSPCPSRHVQLTESCCLFFVL